MLIGVYGVLSKWTLKCSAAEFDARNLTIKQDAASASFLRKYMVLAARSSVPTPNLFPLVPQSHRDEAIPPYQRPFSLGSNLETTADLGSHVSD